MLPAAAAAAGTAAGKITPMLFDFLAKNHKLRGQLKFELVSIRDEFAMISSLIAEDDENRHQRQRSDGDQVHDTWIEMVRQLAHDIDDCIDRFTHRVMLQPGASWIRRKLHRVMTVKARGEFASAVRRLRTRSQDVYDKRKWYTQEPRPNDTTTRSGGSYEEETSEPVGMEAAQEELMELVRETNWTHGQQLKVISLVGFGGIGKTRLAMQLYDHNSNSDLGECQYEARAWAHAGEKGAENVLEDILMQLAAIASGGSLRKLCASLRQWLGTKRFFIVIDDMQVEFWDDIKDAFPSVPGISSRIIVTTNTQSIATKCSIDGHVYIMTTLDDEHSRQLFFKKASLVYPPQPGDKEMGSQVIKKCDGLPLALVTTARVLRGDPTQKDWTDLGENLGEELEKNKNLASMKHVLVRSYTTLGSKEMKTCLLYLGIYPSGRPIRRGSLVRKWLAEGFIKDDLTTKRNSLGVATLNFDTLVDRSIIQPIIDVNSTNITKVKTCRTHGMMREFILRESMSENFVTVLYDENPPQRSNIRWLSLQHQNAARARMKPEDLRLVRSLTIFGEAHNSVLDFSKYKQLKVLDLEECTFHMGDQHLKDICSNLVLLRYLSLGAAVTATVLPNKIKKLKLLETLDVRRTKIEILPTQVLKLPCLVHLFGKLKLQEDVGEREMHKIQAWLKENSKLETVAGFVVDKSKKMPQLIEHMDHLTKVKIWYKSTADDSSNSSHLSKSIKEFIQRGTDLNKTRSLSLNINGEWPEDMLNISLEMDYSYYLSSLKIEGNTICRQLPPFVTMLGSLTKLCLSFPGHKLRGDVLDVVLSNVRGLEYLKLIATELDKLVIRQDQLRILRSLCIVVHVMTGLVIEDRALLRLHSLQLLCKDLNGFSSTTIQSLPLLKEVALHDELSDQAEQDWKEEAKKHPRRPKVLCKLKGSKPAARTSTPATSTGALARVVAIESGPVENSESLGAPPTNMTLPQTTEQLRAILFQFVTSEMGSEPAAEITPAAIATDMMTQEVAVESEPVENSESPVAPPTDMRLPVTMPPKAISNGESVQVDGDGQHDDHETEDVYNTRGPNYFASENGPSTLMASVQKEMEGVAV